MSKAAEAELRLKFKDAGATSGIDKAAKRVEQITKQTEQVVNQSNSRQRSSFERLSLAREQLGMRSEKRIQLEISRTESAYKRLATSGKLSQDELSRAAEKTRQKITKLTNEMGKLTKEQQAAAQAAKQFETAQGRIRNGVAVGAGVAAAGYALKAPVMNAMSFDERLRYMANTAFRERDTSGRLIGATQLEGAINSSIKEGGTREDAAGALETLLQSGMVGTTDAMSMLPALMKGQNASRASATSLAEIGIKAIKGFGIAPSEFSNILNMAHAGGKAGNFELENMAKWLPQQMAAAGAAGISGKAGFAKLVGINQGAVLNAGTKDEAGNNVVNMLQKLNSADSAKDVQKQLGINLSGHLQKRRGQGVDAIDAFVELLDKSVSKNTNYQDLQKKLKNSKNSEERTTTLESMARIAEGSGVGKLIQDRQALMGFMSYMNNRDFVNQVVKEVKANDVSAGGEIDKDQVVMKDSPMFKVREAEQQAAIAQKNAMDALTPTIGRIAEGFSDLSQKYPDLSAAVVGATPPMLAVGAAAGALSISLGGAAGTTGLAGAATMTASKLVAAGALVSSAMAGYDFGKNVVKPAIDEVVRYFTGDKDATLGTKVYDLLNKPVDVNINLNTTVEEKPGFMTRQKVTKVSGGQVNHAETGNIQTGAPGSP